MPSWGASSVVDQCVTAYFFGSGVNVAGPADPSAGIPIPPPITVGRHNPNLTAIAVLDTPSAASNPTRARQACPHRLDRVNRASSSLTQAPTPGQDDSPHPTT